MPLGQDATKLSFHIVKINGLRSFPSYKTTAYNYLRKYEPKEKSLLPTGILTSPYHSFGIGFSGMNDAGERSPGIFLDGVSTSVARQWLLLGSLKEGPEEQEGYAWPSCKGIK